MVRRAQPFRAVRTAAGAAGVVSSSWAVLAARRSAGLATPTTRAGACGPGSGRLARWIGTHAPGRAASARRHSGKDDVPHTTIGSLDRRFGDAEQQPGL